MVVCLEEMFYRVYGLSLRVVYIVSRFSGDSIEFSGVFFSL